jgi:hypothetical protein
MNPKIPPRRNGIRHAPRRISSLPKVRSSPIAVKEPSKSPVTKPLVSRPIARPDFLFAACSATNTHAPGISPPNAAPCTIRMRSRSNGAAIPTDANVGSRPIVRVGSAIRSTLAVNTRLRPRVSPKCASTIPPKGRAK